MRPERMLAGLHDVEAFVELVVSDEHVRDVIADVAAMSCSACRTCSDPGRQPASGRT